MAPRIDKNAKLPADQILNNKEEAKFAEEYFSGKLILPRPAYPLRGAGALAWIDPDSPNRISYTRLLPDKKLPDPEALSDVLFESIVDSQFAANASYLAFVSAEMKSEDKAVVSMQRTLRALGPEYFTKEVQEAIAREIPKFKTKPGRKFYYLETIQMIVTTSSVLRKDTAAATGAFYVNLGGSTFSSASRTSTNQFAVAEYVELGEHGIAIPETIKVTESNKQMFSVWNLKLPEKAAPRKPLRFTEIQEIQ